MSNLTPDTNFALIHAAQSGDKIGQAARNVNASKSGPMSLDKIEETAKEFEAVFLSEMMKPMFEGIEAEAPFGGGKGEEIFRGLLVQEYGKILSKTGGVGIADQVKEQMIRMQEQANNAQTAAIE